LGIYLKLKFLGGLLHITGDKIAPSKVGVAITDICTGLYGSGAILAALLHRYKTGQGQKIDVDLFSTQISCLINVGVNYLNSKIEAERWGTEHVSIVPYAAFETKNGFFTIGAASNEQFAELCRLMDIKNLLSDEKFSSNAGRVKNRDELTIILNNLFKQHSNDFWSEKFTNASFPYGPVNNMEGVFSDEHVKEIGIVKKLQHKDAGDVFVVGPPVVFSESENKVFSAPPTLGEHTDDILKSMLNYDDDKISDLRSQKIIQ
jgi:succinate--hydroxymethylglutarate CoA-transferase